MFLKSFIRNFEQKSHNFSLFLINLFQNGIYFQFLSSFSPILRIFSETDTLIIRNSPIFIVIFNEGTTFHGIAPGVGHF